MDGMYVNLVNLDSSGKMVIKLIKETVSSVKRKYQDATDAKMESSVINAQKATTHLLIRRVVFLPSNTASLTLQTTDKLLELQDA